MVILKILGFIVLSALVMFAVYFISLGLLMCYGERQEERRRQEEHLKENENLENFQYGWSWDEEHLQEFEEMKTKADEATRESKEQNVSHGTHR